MKNKFMVKISIAMIAMLVAGCAGIRYRDLASFNQGNTRCYNRQTEPYTSVVDSHLHFRPFGGPPIPFTELMKYFNKTGVLFVNVYGIGQILPVDSSCTYYLDCPGTPALPSIKNDFVNAANYLELKPKGVHLTLSMTFPELANPADITKMIHLYDKEYPKMFKWMGEVNLIKQALLKNHHKPATKENIKQWAEFMALLKERNIPINIHSDLGNDAAPKTFLPLMEYVLELYPDNKIVWAHMGLSKELTTMIAAEHIRIMKSFLDKNPNLMLDISWRVLYDNYFSKPEARDLYVAFLNKYSDRILPGTDFVAARSKQFAVYQEELEVNSRINRYLNDEAFRNIALGGNYFRILGLNYQAPQICH
ncbi:MAG: amidohydrolase family protein [Gammaproteobacteria bacterium]